MPADGCLEFGGSHVSVGLVDRDSWALTDFRRHRIDSTASLADLAGVVEAAVGVLPRPLPERWAVALPGPFDYDRGIGGRHPAGKFAAWAGQDVAALLSPLLARGRITFVNDAVAFALGHYVASPGISRLLGLTLGSGIGSAFIDNGRPVVDDRVPPGGELYATAAGDGLTLESRFGPAALARAGGHDSFLALAEAARTDPALRRRLAARFLGFADALAPWLQSFRPQVVACGGGVCHAWDLFGAGFIERLTAAQPGLEVTVNAETERAAMRGAVAYAAGRVE